MLKATSADPHSIKQLGAGSRRPPCTALTPHAYCLESSVDTRRRVPAAAAGRPGPGGRGRVHASRQVRPRSVALRGPCQSVLLWHSSLTCLRLWQAGAGHRPPRSALVALVTDQPAALADWCGAPSAAQPTGSSASSAAPRSRAPCAPQERHDCPRIVSHPAVNKEGRNT